MSLYARNRALAVAFTGLTCALAACSRSEKPKLPGDDEIVARVGGKPITRYDVEAQGRRSLGQFSVGSIQRTAYPKLVEAAIQGKAIALAAERELTPTEKLALERDVQAYRDQLLVRMYLHRHNPPKPVTREMALDYYKRFPEQFGATKQRTYELVGTTRALASHERLAILGELEHAAEKSDWKAWAEELAKRSLSVSYSSVSSSDRTIDPKLGELLDGLKSSQPSPPVFVQGRAYVARMTGEATKPPRPFEEVREEVERLLGPAQISTAVEAAAREVMKTERVELVNAPKSAAPHPLASKGGKK
jgi:hypothetical protein